MKAITILQPWASLIACGAKKIETRSWKTSYRGPIAIQCAKSTKASHMDISFTEPFYSVLKNQSGCMGYFEHIGGGRRILFPDHGTVIAIAELIDCIEMTDEFIDTLPQNELAFGWFDIGRYAWILDNVRQIDPVPAKGKQRLWELDGDS